MTRGLPAVGRGLCVTRFYRGGRGTGPGAGGTTASQDANRLANRLGPHPATLHTDRMLSHTTFVFTYGNRPTGCHGRAA